MAEVFATLTGGRLGFRYQGDDAAALVREITARMRFVELDGVETQTALEAARARGVRGGRVHDWLHSRAAAKAGVEQLLTANLADFRDLSDGFQVLAP